MVMAIVIIVVAVVVICVCVCVYAVRSLLNAENRQTDRQTNRHWELSIARPAQWPIDLEGKEQAKGALFSAYLGADVPLCVSHFLTHAIDMSFSDNLCFAVFAVSLVSSMLWHKNVWMSEICERAWAAKKHLLSSANAKVHQLDWH